MTVNLEALKPALKTQSPIEYNVKAVLLFFTYRLTIKYFRSHRGHVTAVSLVYNIWHVSIWNMSFTKKTGGKALDALQNLPRITLANLRPEPGAKKAVSYIAFFNISS